MTEAERPDPDEILARMKREETAATRGKLKIFFRDVAWRGQDLRHAASGAAKTSGGTRSRRRHCRNTWPQRNGSVDRRHADHAAHPSRISRHDAQRDGSRCHPDLASRVAVVDELAHTNAPGSRHPKRYQDVIELLDAGIDVYTTLNVQHVASRSDTVRQISGITVSETVPDSVLDLADEIVLVDLTPEQLRARLAEGKVYLGERAEWAAKNFFRESNLTALREMALRLVAEHVDRDLRDIMSEEKIVGPWKSSDRLLVAVSASPYSERLIRYTRRLAASMEASWIVANIEQTARAFAGGTNTLDSLSRARAPARRGSDFHARHRYRRSVAPYRPSTQRHSDCYRQTARLAMDKLFETRPAALAHAQQRQHRHPHDPGGRIGPAVASETIEERLARAPWRDFGVALVIAAVVTAFSLSIFDYTGYWAVSLFYLLAVVLAATRLRRWPTLFLAALSALLWDFLFIPPRFTFYITHLHDFLMFGAYFVIALVIGHLATKLREREQSERRREERATALYRFTRALAASRDLDEALPKVLALIKDSFQADAAVWLRDECGLSCHSAASLSRLRAKMKVSLSGRFKKNKRRKIDRHTTGCRLVACSTGYRRPRRRRAHRAARIVRPHSSSANCSMLSPPSSRSL